MTTIELFPAVDTKADKVARGEPFLCKEFTSHWLCSKLWVGTRCSEWTAIPFCSQGGCSLAEEAEGHCAGT